MLEHFGPAMRNLRSPAAVRLENAAPIRNARGTTLQEALARNNRLRAPRPTIPTGLTGERISRGLQRPGYKRLYRGEGASKGNPFDDLKISHERALDRGAWYTDNPKIAAEYARKNKGKVHFIEVPNEIAHAFGRKKPDYGWREYRIPEKYRRSKHPHK